MLPSLFAVLLALPAVVLGSPLASTGQLAPRKNEGNGWGQGHGSGKPDKGQGMPAEVAFVLVGDSTTNNGTTPNSGGWSRGFCGSLAEGTFCSNRAANGRTTGTIVTDGFWTAAMDDLKGEVAKGKTVFVTLQFGHNDQKIAPASSMAQNLTLFTDEIRQNGGHPVLVTALTRRGFSNTTNMVSDALADWAQATIDVANAKSAPLLDLHKASLAYVNHIGKDAAQLLNRLPEDRTHLNLSGQLLFGRMVADLFQTAVANFPGVPKFLSPFNVDPKLSLALYAGEQSVFTPVYPDNSTTPCCYPGA